MEHLRTEYTEVWAPSRNLPLIRFADRTRALAATGIDLVGVTEPALPVWAEFDAIVSWYGTNRAEFREAVAGLPFTFLPALPDGKDHAADFYLRQVGAKTGGVPRLDCPRVDRGFVAVHPFSGSAQKNWPRERYLELAARCPMPVRFCVEESGLLPDALVIPDLWDLACWLASARAYVGNDSGITHLAAAAGAPVVALFGPTDPAVWAPRGARVIRREPVEEIGVEEVLLAIEGLVCSGTDRPSGSRP
jgi:hypothetical protein